jgi:hypothetical protein
VQVGEEHGEQHRRQGLVRGGDPRSPPGQAAQRLEPRALEGDLTAVAAEVATPPGDAVEAHGLDRGGQALSPEGLRGAALGRAAELAAEAEVLGERGEGRRIAAGAVGLQRVAVDQRTRPGVGHQVVQAQVPEGAPGPQAQERAVEAAPVDGQGQPPALVDPGTGGRLGIGGARDVDPLEAVVDPGEHPLAGGTVSSDLEDGPQGVAAGDHRAEGALQPGAIDVGPDGKRRHDVAGRRLGGELVLDPHQELPIGQFARAHGQTHIGPLSPLGAAGPLATRG